MNLSHISDIGFNDNRTHKILKQFAFVLSRFVCDLHLHFTIQCEHSSNTHLHYYYRSVARIWWNGLAANTHIVAARYAGSSTTCRMNHLHTTERFPLCLFNTLIRLVFRFCLDLHWKESWNSIFIANRLDREFPFILIRYEQKRVAIAVWLSGCYSHSYICTQYWMLYSA